MYFKATSTLCYAMLADSPLPTIDSLWNYGQPSQSREKFASLLPQAQAARNHCFLLELKTQIARTHGLEGNFDEAHEVLNEVEDSMLADCERAELRLLLERGRCYRSSGDPASSLPYFEQAVELGTRIGEWRLAIDAVHMVALAKPSVEERIEWNLRGLRMVEEHPEQRGWLWALYNNLGEEYLRASEYAPAAQIFAKLLTYQKERNGSADIYTVKDYSRAQRLNGHADESAVLMQQELDKLLAASNDDGWIREELAEALEALGRRSEADVHFVRAHDLLKNDPYCLQHETEKLRHLQERASIQH